MDTQTVLRALFTHHVAQIVAEALAAADEKCLQAYLYEKPIPTKHDYTIVDVDACVIVADNEIKMVHVEIFGHQLMIVSTGHGWYKGAPEHKEAICAGMARGLVPGIRRKFLTDTNLVATVYPV